MKKKNTACIGSACHVKGSARVVELLEKLVKTYQVADKVEFAGIFCTGNCKRGVSTSFDGKSFSLNENNTEEFFVKEVLPTLK